MEIKITTHHQVDLVDITAQVQQRVTQTGVQAGICFLFCPHTTAGVVLNENWDPSVEQDVAMVLARMVPEGLPYTHAEGNSPAHTKAILVAADHFVFICHGQLELGRWQGIFFAEFDGPRQRTLKIKVVSQ